MPWYPPAVKKNIPPGSNDPKIRVRGIVNHIRAGLGDTLFQVFQTRGGIESHFYVRNSGVVEQYRDTDYEADAQTDGNSFFIDGVRWGHISIEHEGREGDPLTPAQIEADKKLFVWIHNTHGVPLQRLPTWNGRGIGWHAQYPEFNPLRKSCPTQTRISQIKNKLEPWYPYALIPPVVVKTPSSPATPVEVIPLPVPLFQESEMRIVQISTDKAPQRIFFLRGDRADHVETMAEVRELLDLTDQKDTSQIKESTLRTFFPEINPLMTLLGKVYDEQKAQGASIEQIMAAQAEAAKNWKEGQLD